MLADDVTEPKSSQSVNHLQVSPDWTLHFEHVVKHKLLGFCSLSRCHAARAVSFLHLLLLYVIVVSASFFSFFLTLPVFYVLWESNFPTAICISYKVQLSAQSLISQGFSNFTHNKASAALHIKNTTVWTHLISHLKTHPTIIVSKRSQKWC